MLIVKRAALIIAIVLYCALYAFALFKSIGIIKAELKKDKMPVKWMPKKQKTIVLVIMLCDLLSFLTALFLYYFLSGDEIFEAVLYAAMTCAKIMGRLPTLLLITWLLSLLTHDWLFRKNHSGTDTNN
jgi:NADH:ubiquinone oxidoreductase subunit 5 (subunit L)/multisubunit Na+/H+ antiporter MnhA subunit